MPRKPMDYSKAVVYKICCKDIDIKDCYVGSTTCLRNRKTKHKSDCNNEKGKSYNCPVYKFIRDNGGWDNWEVVMLEEYPECKSGEELLKYEREHFEMLGATLNGCVPARTAEESSIIYREKNKEKINARQRDYNKKNKEKLNAKKREYHERNKDEQNAKSKEYREKHREELNAKRREYHERNKDEQNAKKREYYEKNKEKIAKKVECEFCGSIINKSGMSKHRKSKKCLAHQK